MSVRVPLPGGCYGIKTRDGREYNTTRPGGTVVMEDHHAAQIAGSSAGYNSILSAGRSYSVGTKKETRCDSCGFIGQAWSTTCPRCEGPMRKAQV